MGVIYPLHFHRRVDRLWTLQNESRGWPVPRECAHGREIGWVELEHSLRHCPSRAGTFSARGGQEGDR
jgi:hypothetical protein